MPHSSSKLILVTGDPICDHSYYKGNRRTADSRETPGFRFFRTGGGALLLEKLIRRATSCTKVDSGQDLVVSWKTEFGLNSDFKKLPPKHHAFCFWEPQAGAKSSKVWRAAEPPFGYGHDTLDPETEDPDAYHKEAIRPRAEPLTGPPEILVIDDADIGFRDAAMETCFPWKCEGPETAGPRWVVMKLTGSFGEGALWKEVVKRFKDNLILILSADRLRRSDVRISRGLSWEATAEDITAELRGNPLLKPLLEARHLIITFKSDAAYWRDNKPGAASSMLVFDAIRAEGEWDESQGEGTVFGFLSCFATAVVCELCRAKEGIEPDFEGALSAGLEASRTLRLAGHGPVTIKQKQDRGPDKEVDNPKPGFPFDAIAESICARGGKFASVLIPEDPAPRGEWMMLDDWQVHAGSRIGQRPHHGAAYAIAKVGPGALERFPVAQFGALQTADRKEIESLRTIRRLIRAYEKGGSQKKPLNLGVFGPPGAGKSFGVSQIAMAVLGLKKEEILTFNLSQFSDPEDLNGALHQVRDRVLSGPTPLVFWDEFDAQGYKWLQYLLAPMQDGAFQDRQITHPIGKCVFVFAGATSPTLGTFGPRNPELLHPDEAIAPDQRRNIEEKWLDFVLKKGPDFRSRLVGYLNVLGPNQRQKCKEQDGRRYWSDDETDLCYPIRRALFIRSQFKLKDGMPLEMDTGVLHALLEIPQYKQGARSLEFLCQNLREQAQGDVPRRSHLPALHLLDMHVDAAAFWNICERELAYLPYGSVLGPDLHEDWRRNPATQADNSSNRLWGALTLAEQQSNILQALRIPANLAVLGLRIEAGPPLLADDEQTVRDLIERNIEILAETEHNGWMVETLIAGWRYAHIPKKDPVKKLHPLLLPYAQLAETEKEKDRRPIRGFTPSASGEEKIEGYIERLRRIGFRIVPIASPATPSASKR